MMELGQTLRAFTFASEILQRSRCFAQSRDSLA